MITYVNVLLTYLCKSITNLAVQNFVSVSHTSINSSFVGIPINFLLKSFRPTNNLTSRIVVPC